MSTLSTNPTMSPLSSASSGSTFTFGTNSSMTSPAISPTHSYSNIVPDTDVIPAHHDARTLVLCFDGTGDQFDSDNSNVVQFFSMLKKDDRSQQMCYYQAGIGTYTTPEIATPFWSNISKTLDEMIAWNMDVHVMGGYEFLMENYTAGDKICIFGFSRGAYTARALAGMIHKVGLLPASNHQQIPFAYKMYTRVDDLGWKQSNAFKKAFSIDVDIEFIGVWDTVCSVGIIPRTLPFTSSNNSIRTFRHAVSLDEHRAKFKANLFNRPTKAESKLGLRVGEMPKSGAESSEKSSNSKNHKLIDVDDDDDSPVDGTPCETDVLEVWFAGCHCDVGGGSVPNDSRHNLARIPLRWMIRQCFKANTGIRFHAELLKNVGLNPAMLYPKVVDRPPALSPSASPYSSEYAHGRSPTDASATTAVDAPLSEEEEDLIDSLCPIYDQLRIAPAWWSLEVLPMQHRHQNKDNQWEDYLLINLGRGRKVPVHKPLHIHRSVKTRLEAQGLTGGPYKTNAVYKNEPIWVD